MELNSFKDEPIALQRTEKKLQEARKAAQDVREEIETALKDLTDEQRAVIRARYLEGDGLKLPAWSKVAAEVGYSPSRTYDFHREALIILEKSLIKC
jgi:DNA-directed RNA polymerase sigma subunit (sigma70/sigma32)